MDHIVSLLYIKMELKSDQLIALKRGLFVWHSIKYDVQSKFLTPSGHGSHKPKYHRQRIHLLLSVTENNLPIQTVKT